MGTDIDTRREQGTAEHKDTHGFKQRQVMTVSKLWTSEFSMTSGEWSVLHILNSRTPAQLFSHCSLQSWKPKF